MQICPTLVLLINIVNGKMRQTMKGFSFSESGDFSPFSLHFKTSDITEIRDKYLKCVPSNFNMMELKEDEALTQIMVVFRIRIRIMQGPSSKEMDAQLSQIRKWIMQWHQYLKQ